MKVIDVNKQAPFEYFIGDKYEAGVVLEGAEVKSLRAGRASLGESFCEIRGGEIFLKNMHIALYDKSGAFSTRDSRKDRKLLLHRFEISKIVGRVNEKGYTLVPLQVYFRGSLAKVEVGLARGKKLYDKREDIAKKDQRRETQREFKVKNLY